MTKREGVSLVTRALAFMQLLSALMELSYIPSRLIWMAHYAGHSSVLAASNSAVHVERLELLLVICRAAILLAAAILLIRGGPWITAFLCPASLADETSRE